MHWTHLRRFLDSLVTKVYVLFAAAVPLSYVANLGIDLTPFRVALVGAIILLVGYMLTLLLIPNLLSQFNTEQDYHAHVQRLEQQAILDVELEFAAISDLKKIKKNGGLTLPSVFDENSEIKELHTALGTPKACYFFSYLRFRHENKRHAFMRWLITFSIVAGFVMMNLRPIKFVFGI